VTRGENVQPDLITLAKSLGGGVAVAAIGGTKAVMDHVAAGGYEMVGTFNGNPLAMAATRAMLTEVATPEAYGKIEKLRQRAARGIQRAITDNGLTAHVVTTRTGSTSTTAGSSCRPGARSSSGSSRCSTTRRTSTAWSRTSPSSPRP
jgi:glutamate-1-semialdehyde 2,1-aminomutase